LLVELAAFVRLRVVAPEMPRPWRGPGGPAVAGAAVAGPRPFCLGAVATPGVTDTIAGGGGAAPRPPGYPLPRPRAGPGGGGARMKGLINSVAYADGLRVGEVAIPDISEVLREPGRFVWVGLHEPDEEMLAEIQQEFSLHDLAVEDAARAHQRPKLERYGNSIFVV